MDSTSMEKSIISEFCILGRFTKQKVEKKKEKKKRKIQFYRHPHMTKSFKRKGNRKFSRNKKK